jgi:hypothetical protein
VAAANGGPAGDHSVLRFQPVHATESILWGLDRIIRVDAKRAREFSEVPGGPRPMLDVFLLRGGAGPVCLAKDHPAFAPDDFRVSRSY